MKRIAFRVDGFAISPNDVLVKLVDGLCPDCKADGSFQADDTGCECEEGEDCEDTCSVCVQCGIRTQTAHTPFADERFWPDEDKEERIKAAASTFGPIEDKGCDYCGEWVVNRSLNLTHNEPGVWNKATPFGDRVFVPRFKRKSFNRAESFEAQGTLKFSNTELLQILMNENWKCSHCNNIIKNKQNTPFSEQEQNNVTWALFEDLSNYDDINVRRKLPRSSPGSSARKEDRTLNFDNLLLLCYECMEKKSRKRVSISFRTSLDNKEWLKGQAKDKDMTELLNQIVQEYRNNYEAESFEADDDVFTHSVVLGFKFKYYTKQNPLYKKKEDGSFNLDPIHIVKLKILILREMDLVGVEYQDATITADSLLFKFDFTNEIEAQKFSAYVREYLSQSEKVEQLQQYFDKADARVMTKYEAGILFSTLMDWSNREYLIDFLEYLIKLEEYDYDYSLQFIRERGVDINEQDDYGVSLKDLMLAEKEGYQSMLEELINDIKNKGRRLDDVAFTLSADNGLKNQTMASMFAIQQAIEGGMVNRTMSLQYLRYEGKLEAINQFLYYVYGDEGSFIFDNI